MTLSVLVFQHDPFDGPGYLGEALVRHGASLEIVRLDQGQAIPDPSKYDMLLVMGGEMNVYQEDKYPWLAPETRIIRHVVDSGKAVLGVCLGGQLLARALDARVRVGAATEIGLTPIRLTSEGKVDPLFEGLDSMEAVEWHDDTFDVPSGAVQLAASDGCAHQAFRLGTAAYGLQFHPEVSPEMLAQWIKAAHEVGIDTLSFQQAVDTKANVLQNQATRLVDNFVRTCIPTKRPFNREARKERKGF